MVYMYKCMYSVYVHVQEVHYSHALLYQGHMEGGLLGFQEIPFDSKTISKITCLINILASYAYLSVNTI